MLKKQLKKFAILTAQSTWSVLQVTRKYQKSTWKAQVPRKNKALILANGPSLSEDVGPIRNAAISGLYDCWCVNYFALTELFGQIKPAYYVLADPNFWSDSAPPDQVAMRAELFTALTDQVCWPFTIFVPSDARKYGLKERLESQYVSVVFYNAVSVNGFPRLTHWLFLHGLGMPPTFNVLIAAAYLSISMRYRNIYIAGADHSWHESVAVDGTNSAVVRQKHFYDQDTANVESVLKPNSEEFTIGDLFVRWGHVFLTYRHLQKYALRMGVDVCNVSGKSYIDAFRKANISCL